MNSTDTINKLHQSLQGRLNDAPNPGFDPQSVFTPISKVTNETEKQKQFFEDLNAELTKVRHMLVEKNRKYGDSALTPSRVFSKASVIEQIKVRIDDKLTRLSNQQADEDEDVVSDLIGYLFILKIAKKRLVGSIR